MPTYVYECQQHGRFERALRMKDHTSTAACPHCAATSPQVITRPMVIFDVAPWAAFESPTTGKLITSRRESHEDLRRSGCRLLEPGESDQYRKDEARRQKENEKASEALVDHIVSETARSF